MIKSTDPVKAFFFWRVWERKVEGLVAKMAKNNPFPKSNDRHRIWESYMNSSGSPPIHFQEYHNLRKKAENQAVEELLLAIGEDEKMRASNNRIPLYNFIYVSNYEYRIHKKVACILLTVFVASSFLYFTKKGVTSQLLIKLRRTLTPVKAFLEHAVIFKNRLSTGHLSR